MSEQRIAGMLEFNIEGVPYDASGNFSYGLGVPKKEAVMSNGKVIGYKETPTVPFIEGEVIDRANLDVKALFSIKDKSIYLKLGNGKLISLREAWYAGEGTGQTDEAKLQVRFEGLDAEETA